MAKLSFPVNAQLHLIPLIAHPEPPNEVRADETPGAEDQDLAGHGDVDPALVKNGAIRPWMRRKATVSQPMSLPRQSSAA